MKITLRHRTRVACQQGRELLELRASQMQCDDCECEICSEGLEYDPQLANMMLEAAVACSSIERWFNDNDEISESQIAKSVVRLLRYFSICASDNNPIAKWMFDELITELGGDNDNGLLELGMKRSRFLH